MPRNWSKAVPKDNDPTPQDAYAMLRGIKLGKTRRIMSQALDKAFNQPTENMRMANQRLAGLEQKARQPRFATEADIPTKTKTLKRMKDAEADQAKNPTSSTSYGMKTEPPALPRRDDVLVDKSTAAPKPCLSPVKMRANSRRWLTSRRQSLYSD